MRHLSSKLRSYADPSIVFIGSVVGLTKQNIQGQLCEVIRAPATGIIRGSARVSRSRSRIKATIPNCRTRTRTRIKTKIPICRTKARTRKEAHRPSARSFHWMGVRDI